MSTAEEQDLVMATELAPESLVTAFELAQGSKHTTVELMQFGGRLCSLCLQHRRRLPSV